LKAPGFNPWTCEVKKRFQSLLFQIHLYRYKEDEVDTAPPPPPPTAFGAAAVGL
jgi:hypothetical protein